MRRRETITAWLFLSPALCGFLLFYVIPFGESLWYSMQSGMFGGSFVGLENYARLLGNEDFILAMSNTFALMFTGVPLCTALGLMLAMMFRHVTHGAKLFKTAILAALVLPAASVSSVWNSFFADNGVVNGIITALGGKPIGFFSSEWSRVVVLMLYIWRNTGYNMVIFTAGLAAIPNEYYEVAKLEGAGPLQTFRHVTLPYIKHSMFFVMLMSVTGVFKLFREIYALSGAYPHRSIYMLQSYMNDMFSKLDYQLLCAAAVIVVGMILVPVCMYIRRSADE